ncbi:MAG: sensor histidine kinase [Jatrophihabitans sp.]|uniref:sensor histidine kinase n=1 Tax=Jatrophihabitans sp. TaxID=1932789 RepID=UPI003F7EDB4F
MPDVVAEPVPPRRRRSARGPLGAALGAAGAVALTAVLVPFRADLSLTSAALLYLPVVAAAALGGPSSGLVVAALSDLLLNWYFIPPLHTLSVARGQHVVVLVVYVLVAAVVAVTVEVGARRRAVAERTSLAAAAQARELAEADRVRSALLAAVGHDLRTPLAGIKAAVSGLRDQSVRLSDADRHELERTIEEGTDQLADLIANLLDMSRLEAGAVVLRLEPVPVEAVAARAAMRADVPVSITVADDLFVRADAGLLERVVANLVGNAARVSPSVLVTADRVGDGVRLAVVDRGPGVPAADRDRMFRPFQQLDDRSSHAGPGLGLAIARGFTEAMGGRLEPADTPGGGLTMTVTLPAA